MTSVFNCFGTNEWSTRCRFPEWVDPGRKFIFKRLDTFSLSQEKSVALFKKLSEKMAAL
jgi:hypothetical protein